ncbi:cytochrome P450 [Sphingomonas sp. BIUV-7]|uniref:Cytochrome P450 n=1 Tax=Sphingomonas natans TaxID=3063330 RepID=A0ABT8Y9X8_9SPHN|nr:cytochrome P450 [Sphingomonas sp. BIUV-7]MDO6414465.1 cytochrome P450 [Sphingomonas sp. BIUV-7]
MTALSPAVPTPEHVPPAAIYDFDMFLDPALLADPHERIRELVREAPPVFWTPRNGGHWTVIGHKENYAASRDTETFSSEVMTRDEMAAMKPHILAAMPGATHLPLPTPINMDPPDHTRFRAPLNTAFSPKAMMARKEEVRALANELIDAVIAQGHCDFIPAIAEPLPVQVFLKLMGLPIERMGEFRELVHEFLAPMETPLDPLFRMRKVAEAMRPELEARRDAPKSDLISLLWSTEIDGKPMTYETMEDFGVLLFIAGLDTVINGMGYGIRHLAMNPDFQNELRANPKRITEAAEELLRRYTFTVPTRRIAKDAEFAGWQMKTGDRLMLFLPAADLDPREFAEPERFSLERENNVHIAFGVGPHRCLGSHLARIELQVIYEQMLARLPTFRIDGTKPMKFHGGNIIAIDSLPLRWD